MEEREPKNSFATVWLSYFIKSVLKSPRKKIVLFSFDRLSNNFLAYLLFNSSRSIPECLHTTPKTISGFLGITIPINVDSNSSNL